VSLELADPTRHGLLDGGHTYRVLQNFIHSANPDELKDINACVRLEVIEGIENLDDAVEIVLARNTSAQVKSESLEELNQHFEEIKQVIKDMPYADRIAYKEYEIDENTGEAKDIDIKEILSYLVCFDVDHFDQEHHPIMAYSQKSNVIEHFKNYRTTLMKYVPLIPRILELRDVIYRDLPEAYNNAGGKFGGLTGVVQINNRPKMSNEELAFISGEAHYRIPSAFIYPVLAAFRNLVKVDENNAVWKDDPVAVFGSLSGVLAKTVGEQAKEMRNPTKLGKDQATWKLCNNIVRIAVLERGL